MVYYTSIAAPWSISDAEGVPSLIFLHNFGGGLQLTNGLRYTLLLPLITAF